MAPSPLLAPLKPSWWLLGLGMTFNEVFTAGAFIPLFGNMLASAMSVVEGKGWGGLVGVVSACRLMAGVMSIRLV